MAPAAPTAKDMKSWMKTHHEELKIGLIATAIAFFFTHGLPLWNDDYSQWLSQANGSFLGLLKRILLPFTSEPQSWGYSDRPMQVFLYKIFSVIFGTWGTGYFLMKSLAFGGLCGVLYHWMRKLDVDRVTSTAMVILFAMSTNAIASLVWHSDFGAYAQLILALILFHSIHQIERGPSSSAVYKKGWAAVPKPFIRFLLIFFIAVYLGSKVRADVRLAPIILLAYLYFFRRERLGVYLAPFGLTFLATLPWSGAFLKRLPPFFPGATGYEGWTYAPFSISRVFEFLIGDWFRVGSAPLSVFGAVGVLLTLGLIAYGGYRMSKEKLKAPSPKVGFLLVWFVVALLGCGILARQGQSFQLRYTLVALVPAILLCGAFFGAAGRDFSRVAWFKPALVAAVVLQGAAHAYHDFVHRRDMGRTMIAANKAFEAVEKEFPNSQLVLLPGFVSYGFRNSSAPALSSRKPLEKIEEIKSYPAGNTYALSWASTLDTRFVLAKAATGCGASLFDLIVRCAPQDGAMLLKYVGDVPALAQAHGLDQQGNLLGARDVLEAYLKDNPENHGAAFILSLYQYRLRDYARMEQIYDRMGPYFMGHGSVVYNWGLAKQGREKFKEAARLFELALRMWPNEYGVGFNLADAYMRQGKKRRALATLNQLMKVYPNDKAMKDTYEAWSK